MVRNGGSGQNLSAQASWPCNCCQHRSGPQIRAFALCRGTRAKTDRIDAKLIARFMAFRPQAGRELPDENLRIPGTLTTRRGQLVDMRKRLKAQIGARRKQGIPAGVETMDDDLKDLLDTQVDDIERRIENVIARVKPLAPRAELLRSIPGIGPVCAAMLIAGLPEPGRMTSGEAAAMTCLALTPHDSGAMRGRRAIAGGRRSLRHVLFQAALSQSGSQACRKTSQRAWEAAQTCHNCNRTQAGHNRKRDHQNRHPLAPSDRRINTVARPVPRPCGDDRGGQFTSFPNPACSPPLRG